MTKRQYLRAPLRSTCLYIDGDYVLKARTNNISEGGILLSELPHIPEINALPIMLSLVEFPRFQSLSFEDLKNLNLDDFPVKIVRVKARLVRSFEGESNIDRIFRKFIGCEFYASNDEFKITVKNYVETYAKNIVYLLSLFESLGNKTEQLEALRTIAQFLGHDRKMKIPLLRAKVLHDYQSLESL
jgi:hypothetical protein